MNSQLMITCLGGEMVAGAQVSHTPQRQKAGGSSRPVSANSGKLSLQVPNLPIAHKSLAKRVNSGYPQAADGSDSGELSLQVPSLPIAHIAHKLLAKRVDSGLPQPADGSKVAKSAEYGEIVRLVNGIDERVMALGAFENLQRDTASRLFYLLGELTVDECAEIFTVQFESGWTLPITATEYG
jgi:hypothetical protein